MHEQNKPLPWYQNLPIQPTYNQQQPTSQHFDPLLDLQNEKTDQSDRLLHHTVKALLTRVSLERNHYSARKEEMQKVSTHTASFRDEIMGMNQQRDSMRWSLEQSLMALSREDRGAQLAFWNDIQNLSKDLLTLMSEQEKTQRRNTLMQATSYVMQPRIP